MADFSSETMETGKNEMIFSTSWKRLTWELCILQKHSSKIKEKLIHFQTLKLKDFIISRSALQILKEVLQAKMKLDNNLLQHEEVKALIKVITEINKDYGIFIFLFVNLLSDTKDKCINQ